MTGKIPFKFGQVVQGKDFCGRADLLRHVMTRIESSQNIVLIGERRIGKTSLIHEAVRKIGGLNMLYVDLMGIKSVDALCKRMLYGIVLMEKRESWIVEIMKSLSHLRPVFSLDPTGVPTVTFDATVRLQADSIPEVMALIKSVAGKKRIAVVFDEFQEILNLKDANEAIGLLRSSVQFQGDIPYAFVGSIRHKMEWIFSSPDSPFFKSAILINVDFLSYDEYSKFLIKRFKEGKRKVDCKAMTTVFDIADNITGDVQQFCRALWEVTKKDDTITEKEIAEAMNLIFADEGKSYEIFLGLLTDLQLKCLYGLAQKGGENIYSSDFVRATGGQSTAAISKHIASMIRKNILYKKGKEVKFLNPFFKIWLLRRGV